MGEIQTKKLSWADELRLAEQQTPGHKASRGPGDTVVLTPIPEYFESLRAQQLAARIGGSAELALLIDDSAA